VESGTPSDHKIELRVGTASSLLVMTGGSGAKVMAPPVPQPLQSFLSNPEKPTLRRTWRIAFVPLYTYRESRA
jgi:hypothetical protein